jgi:hypothetical protein
MSTPPPVEPSLDGLRDGSFFEWIPATCPGPDAYVAPACTSGHWVLTIPDLLELPRTGTPEIFGNVMLIGILLAVLGAMLVLGHVIWVRWRRPYTSRDCRTARHDACEASGGCNGCPCHGAS